MLLRSSRERRQLASEIDDDAATLEPLDDTVHQLARATDVFLVDIVALGLTHTDLTAEYGVRDGMELTLRLPYDVKAMTVRYTTLDGAPFTPPYGDIHHRTETLRGISDPSLDLDVAAGDAWIVALGTTLPAGHIVPDPIVLGREGKTHEHIQFGSGTFEPRLAAQWHRDRWFARAETKLSLYENREG